jgi:hypothetical protein
MTDRNTSENQLDDATISEILDSFCVITDGDKNGTLKERASRVKTIAVLVLNAFLYESLNMGTLYCTLRFW